MDYLNRSQSPFPDSLWDTLDAKAAEAASDLLTGRRFLEVEGPYGAGLTTIEVGNDDYCRDPGPGEAGAVMGRALPVPMLKRGFRMSVRRMAAYMENGQPLDLNPLEEAAEAMAAREEEFVYQGSKDFNLPGLLSAEGRCTHSGGDWSDVDQALEDVVSAVTNLDDAGYRGPYALALSPALYNGLFRRYPGTDMLQLEHLKRLCTRGIFKAPIDGCVVVDPRVGALVVGQDLRAGYAGMDGIHYHLTLTQSLVLRLEDPKAACTITTKSGKGRKG